MEYRTTVLDELGDPDADVGSRPWAIHIRDKLNQLIKDTQSDAFYLEITRNAMVKHHGWQVLNDAKGRPFPSFEAFCSTEKPFGLGYNVAFLDRIIADRKAKTAQEHATQEASGQGRMILDHSEAGAKGGRGNKATDDVCGFPEKRTFGNDPGYLTARIARDRPDILERMQAGEFPSVRAAALEAGFVKPTATVRIDSPAACAQALIRRFSRDELTELLDELQRMLNERR